jgi:HEAT repeat protein
MKEPADSDALSPEIQDIMRNLVSAIRTVKLYPPNNPVYFQSVKKSYETLSKFLESSPEYHAGVQKTWFTYQNTPIGKEAQLNRAIAQDLFAKGIREIVFSAGVTEAEFLDLCRSLALSAEELAMKSGISSLLWEKGAEHIKVTEAGLDEVIATRTDSRTAGGVLEPATAKKKAGFSRGTLVLGDIMTDPSGFGASMVELAKQTKAEHESMEERLYALYQEAGRRIEKEHTAESGDLFEGLAKSVLALESPYREGLVAGKLYGELDAEMADDQAADQQLPSALHEVQTGRFSDSWTVKQVAVLLKKTAARKTAPSSPPQSPDVLEAVPIPQDLIGIAKELAEYSPEEMAELEALGDAGMESDIIEAAVRTLVLLIPLVKSPMRSAPEEKAITRFFGIIHQLEDMLSYLLQKKNYELATRIIRALNLPADPAFKPRMMEALRKTTSKAAIVTAIGEMRKHPKSSPQYQWAYTYVSLLEREATEVLLEFLAAEQDRTARIFYLDLVKSVGKKQIALLGEHLSDDRWYYVRNIVSILAVSGADQAITFLRKAADHKNIRIRQEVVKGLASIGGKKAASVLAKFLRNQEDDIRLMAIRAYADFPEISAEEARPLIEFLEGRPIRNTERELTLEAIKSLGKIGGRDAADFLQRYSRIRWWKPRKLQMELREASRQAIEEITRRKADA